MPHFGTLQAWAFYELARHPEVEARVQAEADEVAGAGPLDFEALAGLSYIDRVINEVTRLYGAVLVMRRAVRPVKIGGFYVPAGSEVAYSLYALQRDPRWVQLVWSEVAGQAPSVYCPCLVPG